MTTPLRRAALWHRPLMIFSAGNAVLAVLAVAGLLADPRELVGAPIWLKVFKFAISLAIYGTTLAWMLSLLPNRSRVGHWAGNIVVITMTAEMIVIVTQVLRGQTSHYNGTTPLNAILWAVMGQSIMVLFLAHLVIAIVLIRRPLADRAAAYAVRLGLGLSLLGMVMAFPMVAIAPEGVEGISGAHSVGVADGGPGLPVTGWSTAGGDLRIGHFVGLHALQALPLLALLLSVLARRSSRLGEKTRVRLLVVAGVAYGVLTVLLTWQALRGQPLLRPDAVSLAALAALVAATVTATAAVLAAGRRADSADVDAEPQPMVVR